jgi:hypothetical protein
MAMIRITCPDCTAVCAIPGRAMLATVDLGGFPEPLGRVSWACLGCSQLVVAEVEMENLLRLLAVGVLLLDDGFGGRLPEEAQLETNSRPLTDPNGRQGDSSAPFTFKDLTSFRELLESEAWAQQLE